MVSTSDGARAFSMREKLYLSTPFVRAEHSRDQITSQSPVERTIKAGFCRSRGDLHQINISWGIILLPCRGISV